MAYEEDIEKLFNQDVREKRSTGSGAFKRKGKGVKHGMRGIRFPSDSLTAAQKRKLNGEVIVVSGLGVKLKIEEFKQKDRVKQKETLEHWRKLYASKDIQEFLGVDKNAYYKMLYDLEILDKPASIKASSTKASSTNSSSANKKYTNTSNLPAATSEDIISYDEFKNLLPNEQLVILDDIYSKYNLHSVVKVWGKTLNNLYNIKFQIKNKVEKQKEIDKGELSIVEAKNTAKVTDDNAQQMQIEDITPQEDEKHEVSSSNSEAQEFIEAQAQEFIETDVQAVEFIETEAQEFIETEKISQIATEEMNVLKEMIFEQNKVIQNILLMQQEVAASTQEKQEVIQAAIPVTVKKSNNTEISFVDEREGFLLYQDIKKFISVLKKNPDLYEVELKIKRKK